MVRWALTAEVPPEEGVRVIEVVAEAGLLTVRTEFSPALIIEIPVICERVESVPETV